MEQDIVYTRSYYGIYLALYLKSRGSSVTIVTPSNDIERFCRETGYPCVKSTNFSSRDFTRYPGMVKDEVQRIDRIIGRNTLHFSHRQFDLFCFLLAREHSAHAPVRFYPIEFRYEPEPVRWRNISNITRIAKAHAKKLFVQQMYDLKLQVVEKSGMSVFALDDEFFNEPNIAVETFEEDFEQIKSRLLLSNEIRTFECRNLFITQNLKARPGLVDEESVVRLYEYLERQDIAVKLHPNMTEDNPFPGKEAYPTYLPAEMLYGNVKNAVLSVHSLGLVNASMVDRIRSVSLMKLVRWCSAQYEEETERFLKESSKGRIQFPSTFGELEDLLRPQGVREGKA